MPSSARERQRTFFPTHINTYRDCPERYYLEYIRNLKRPKPFNRPMLMGAATHRLIAAVLPGFMQTGEIPVDLERRALAEISTTEYPEDEIIHREEDTQAVAEWTATALRMIPTGSVSLLQERNLYAPLARTGLQVGARIDLVIERAGGEIEHIDFKTGKVRDNTVQSLLARTVVGRRFARVRSIRTTTLYLQTCERRSEILDREACQSDWQSIAQNIRDIRSLEVFPPRPGPLCNFCPYQARDCSAW